MRRCIDLGWMGKPNVAPNPMVGALLVYKQNNILGQGYHKIYGSAHAEVMAVGSVLPKQQHLISKSLLYITLAPCCIYGNTPPCTSLITANKIPEVIFACQDTTPGVEDESVAILKKEGVNVLHGIKKEEAFKLFKQRNCFLKNKRPYIIIKFAQSKDNFIGQPGKSVWLSNPVSKMLVHKWRSETGAIIIGKNTALADNPRLNTRLYPGKSPLRIVMDRNLDISSSAHIFDPSAPTWVITEKKKSDYKNMKYIQHDFGSGSLEMILSRLHEAKISALIVEGGAKLINSFIEKDLWDEARVFHCDKTLTTGIPAPVIPVAPSRTIKVANDDLKIHYR